MNSLARLNLARHDQVQESLARNHVLTCGDASSYDNENTPSPRRPAKIQPEERLGWFPCLYLISQRNPVRLTSSVDTIIEETMIDICSHRHTLELCLLCPRHESRWWRHGARISQLCEMGLYGFRLDVKMGHDAHENQEGTQQRDT